MGRLSPVLVAIERWFNPVAARLLASPLHWLLSRWLIVCIYTGRKSGMVYSVPVMYAPHDDKTLVALVGAPEAKTYWRNFTGEPQPVEFFLRGKPVWASARTVRGGPQAAELLRSYLRRFPRAAGRLGLSGPDASGDDLARVAAEQVMVRFDIL